MIKRIEEEELEGLLDLIHQSFKTVSDEFGMTNENCPGHSAFLPYAKLKVMYQDGLKLYGYYQDQLVGCMGIEKKSTVRYKIKLLAVLPEYQHRGFGEDLLNFAGEEIKLMGGHKMQLGMIYENQNLYRWYLLNGFELDKLKTYRGNDFKIAFMEKRL